MPTYTYRCTEHGEFTRLTSMKDHQRLQPCPTCEVASEQVLNTVPTFIRKGGGWTRPDPKIPEWIKKLPDDELDAELGLTNDANAA